MKTITYLLLAVFLSACASTATKETPTPPAPAPVKQTNSSELSAADQMVSKILSEKIAKNGHNILCAEPQYTGCYNITQQQCSAVLQPLNQVCLDQSVKQTGGSISSGNAKKVGAAFGACMALKHLLTLNTGMVETADCIGKMDTKKSNPDALKLLFQ